MAFGIKFILFHILFMELLYNHRIYSYRNCAEAYIANQVNGEYNITQDDYTFPVYCEYNTSSQTGYMHLSRIAIQNNGIFTVNLSSLSDIRSRFKIVLFNENTGLQRYTIIEQLAIYSDREMTLLLNTRLNGYFEQADNLYGDTYLTVNLLGSEPGGVAGVTRGFTTNGEELSFTNCDNNYNALFGFYPNHGNAVGSIYTTNYGLTRNMLNSGVTTLDPILDIDTYGFAGLIGFGGCGAANIFTNHNPSGVNEMATHAGVALPFTFALRFDCSASNCDGDATCLNSFVESNNSKRRYGVMGTHYNVSRYIRCAQICKQSNDGCVGFDYSQERSECVLLGYIGGDLIEDALSTSYRMMRCVEQ